jgi:signal transduction histidine kinase
MKRFTAELELRRHKLWRSVAESSVAILSLIALSAVSYQLHFNLAMSALLFVIVVVLVSRAGGFVSSVVAAIVAALCLTYVAPPAFSFRLDDPLNWLAITAFLITSLIIAGLMSTVRKQAEAALSSVSYRVIQAEEQECRRIAYKLHEDIGQRLTLLLIKIEQLKPDSLNAFGMPSRIDALWKETLEILTDVKSLAHELHSPRLEYLGIAGVMRSFCREFGDRKKVQIDFRSDGLPGFIAPDTALCMFRVLQESLHNAVQHSGVRQFGVQLWATSDEIHLTVTDAGVGFNLETANGGGLGLNRMQERLKLLRGKLSCDSQPQRGTTIHARVPLSFPATRRVGFD